MKQERRGYANDEMTCVSHGELVVGGCVEQDDEAHEVSAAAWDVGRYSACVEDVGYCHRGALSLV